MLEEVGETGIKILLFLYKKRAKLTDFKEELGAGYEAVYRAVLILERHKLINEHCEGKKRVFELSEKGKRIAEKMTEAEKILTEK
jgi:predicted transcriptional regulator